MPVAKDVHVHAHAPDRADDVTGTRHDPLARPQTPAGRGAPATWEADAEAHLIRLCLDLQLDAMMLTLGAASAQARQQDDGATGGPAAPPWRRWVAEDVEMVCTLVADVMAGGATLPALLGSDLDQAVPAAAIDNLVARYESMMVLLADILPPDGSSAAPYRTHAQEALAKCESRLRELRATRLDHTPARGLSLPGSAAVDRVEHRSVPGEWLG